MLARISAAAGRFFALWVVFGALAGSVWPSLFAWVGPHVPFLLGVVMFGMGMTLSGRDFKNALARPREVAVGVLAQYTVMPLTAYGLALALRLPPDIAVGLILVGTCPGGTASNVVTYLARGDLALSVSMTTVATLIAPLLTPLLTLWLAGQWLPVSAGALFVSILKIVLAPVGGRSSRTPVFHGNGQAADTRPAARLRQRHRLDRRLRRRRQRPPHRFEGGNPLRRRRAP